MDLQETFDRLEQFLASYRGHPDAMTSLLGPGIPISRPHWWQFRRAAVDRELRARLKKFGLPELDDNARWRWWMQPGQTREDAGGFVRRKWMVTFGFSLAEFENWYYRPPNSPP